jgi:putative transferase (TIGR04331 family)
MGVRARIKFKSEGRILWLGMSRPRYSSWMCSAPVGMQMLEYIEEQKQFLNWLDVEVKDLLAMRLFHTDFGWNVKERLSDSIPDLHFYEGNETMYQQLCQSRLCIGTYNSTTNLETISANFPTIAFWNFDHWKLREPAVPYFKELCEVGVFHDNPESAAKKINEVYRNPLSWWHSSEVQEAKNKFCHRFARASQAWLSEWKRELFSITRE